MLRWKSSMFRCKNGCGERKGREMPWKQSEANNWWCAPGEVDQGLLLGLADGHGAAAYLADRGGHGGYGQGHVIAPVLRRRL